MGPPIRVVADGGTAAPARASRPTSQGSEPWPAICSLAEDGTPDGTHLHLEANNGRKEGSVGLVLERCDD